MQNLKDSRKNPGDFDLTGKTAVVTGAAGFLGRYFCKALACHGAQVVAADISRNIRPVTRALEGLYPSKILGVACDVSSPKSVKSMIRQTLNRYGRVDILLNNAATKSSDLRAYFAPFEKYSLSQWRKVMAVNIDGVFLAAQAAGTQMTRQRGGGSIIQVASIYGVVAPDQRIYKGSRHGGRPINTPAVYSASKGAVVALGRYLAAYWADKHIRVNTLVPGGIESGQNRAFIKKYSNRVPMARMGSPLDLTGAVVYLASDASLYMTGQEIVVDGGLTAW